jgi:hypothetical protein
MNYKLLLVSVAFLNGKIVLQVLPNKDPQHNIIINNKTNHKINFTIFQHPKYAIHCNKTIGPMSQSKTNYSINKIKTYFIATNRNQNFIQSIDFNEPITVNIVNELDKIQE